MNKLLKGSIAGVAGIALLLGGAGTFALWSDTQDIEGGTVQTGTLDINLAADTAWADISTNAIGGPEFDPTVDEIVPGDVITLTQSVEIIADGKNLLADLTYKADSVVIDPALEPYVTVGIAAAQTTGDATIVSNGTNSFRITPDEGGTSTFQIVITITFSATTPDRLAQTLTPGVDLSDAGFTVTQVRP
jgi:alternate signal-mediated exported protein